jgi:hypothetical protein
MTILVRIAIRSPRGALVEAALVSAALSSSPPHAAKKITPMTSNTALRMPAPSSFDEHDSRQYLPGAVTSASGAFLGSIGLVRARPSGVIPERWRSRARVVS